MKIAIVTYYDNKCSAFGMYSDISKVEYCKKWGFDYRLYRTPYYMNRHPVWNKIPPCIYELPKYDYIFWIDADAIIANMDFDIRNLFSDKDIYISKDCNGYNFGIFAVKNSLVGITFLKRVDNSHDSYKRSKFREQDAAKDLINNEYINNTEEIPIKMWNCYDDMYGCQLNNVFADGDFILHLPSERQLPPNYREKRFKEILRKNGLIK